MLLPGVLPNYQDMPADNFVSEFPGTKMVGINLNQTDPVALRNSADWALGLAKQAIQKGRQVLYTIPCPGVPGGGRGQMENINEGFLDDMLREIRNVIVAAAPKDGSDIHLRPWHEFNLAANKEQAMINKLGQADAYLGLRAWRRMSMVLKNGPEKNRIKIHWSPSVEHPTKSVVDPLKLYPGSDYCDYITPDFYTGYAFYHKPGDYTGGWFRAPFLKLRDLAIEKQKPFGFAEIGADSDDFRADIRMILADAKASGRFEICQWWNDWQVINCQITAGRLPGLKAEYLAATTS